MTGRPSVPLPAGPFDLLYADPPLAFVPRGRNGDHKSPQRHYRCLSHETLLALPVGDLAARNSVLALWCYDPFLPFGLEMMAAWGFRFVTRLLVWVKVNPTGHLQVGTGYYTRKSSEIVLLGKRGRGLPIQHHGVSDVIFAPRQAHSRKPCEARTRLERLFGEVRRVELFARPPMPSGWTGWGDEMDRQPAPTLAGDAS